MSIAEICQRDVITIGAVATLREAATLMREHHVGALVVTSEVAGQNQVVGMLTDRDLAIEVLARGLGAEDIRVAQVASRHLVVVPGSAGIAENVVHMTKEERYERRRVARNGGARQRRRMHR